MKKEELLQNWEKVQREYYKQLNRSEMEEKYIEWFDDDEYPLGTISISEMIEELIESELDCRRDDDIEELTETIEHIKSITKTNKIMNVKERKNKKQKPIETITLETYWYEMEDGTTHYDIDAIREEFERIIECLESGDAVEKTTLDMIFGN
mgnify:CR=1 FL=1